ncbi:LysR family transcriptional regulator [Marinobacter sp. X15-166B]|uniref:LysR family transcriptional regulator n=1 Tax=Marinobacter sp. X15-166B TaxID=1897620 RepID=UPI00085C0D19|nr:LysR family transcriptional regulator [Marinobacter sp. X15-166B]OEY67715.1 LysR family transcriptional regulator [Marinobacter sp. X15-166B]
MDPQYLRAFIAIIDQGSFSEAADQLHLTQPAISKRLATLEQQLGVTLIDRGQRPLQLTDAGSRLLPHAHRILDEVYNARLAVVSSTGVTGRLSLIASHHIGLHHLPAWLHPFNRDYPEVSLELQFMDSESAYDQMLKRTAELAFVTLNEAISHSFNVHLSWQDPMVFVCSPEHPLARLRAPGLNDLAGYDALLPAAGTATYRTISRLFLEANLILKPQMPTNYLETIKVMTSVGLGWSVLPRHMVDDTLSILPLATPLSRVLGAIGLRGRSLSPAAQALLALAGKTQDGC